MNAKPQATDIAVVRRGGPDTEAILDKIFTLDAQYQGKIIRVRSRTEFFRLYLNPILDAAFDAEYRRGIEEAGCWKEESDHE